MSTVTKTTTMQHKMRSFSFSLNSSYSPMLLTLPSELLLEIISLALVDTKPSTLSTLCKDLTIITNTVIYHTVTIDTARCAALFTRSAHANPSVLDNVRHLDLVASNLKESTWEHIWAVLPQCRGLLSVALADEEQTSALSAFLSCGRSEAISSITVRQLPDFPIMHNGRDGASVSRLRVCEPSGVWHSPMSILAAFGSTRELTHLELPRRLNGNEENDEIFAAEVKEILSTMPSLQTVVVRLFPSAWADHGDDVDAAKSHITTMLSGVDDRLVLAQGKYNQLMVSSW